MYSSKCHQRDAGLQVTSAIGTAEGGVGRLRAGGCDLIDRIRDPLIVYLRDHEMIERDGGVARRRHRHDGWGDARAPHRAGRGGHDPPRGKLIGMRRPLRGGDPPVCRHDDARHPQAINGMPQRRPRIGGQATGGACRLHPRVVKEEATNREYHKQSDLTQ